MSFRVNAAGMGSMRQLSPDIWHNCDVIDKAGPTPGLGSYRFMEFNKHIDLTSAVEITITQTNSGGVSLSDTRDGIFVVDSAGSNAQFDGVEVQWIGTDTAEWWLPEVNEKLWFEALISLNDVDDEFFIGLAETHTTLMASGSLDVSDISAIGFYCDTGTTAGHFEFVSSNTGSNTVDTDVFNCTANGVVAADGEYLKLGFVVEEVSGAFVIKTYCKPSASASRNDVRGNWMTTAASVPITASADEMCLSAVAKVEATGADAEMSIDWVCIAQGF
jgi:hypothetical protein